MTDTSQTAEITPEAILTQLKELFQQVIKPEALAFVNVDQLTLETPLLSLPMDSLELMELMTKIEETFRVYVPEDQAFGFQTLGNVVTYIQEKLVAKAQRAAAKVAQSD